MKYPVVSAIITTKNSSATLGALLESIKRQTFSKSEVVVVDNNSFDQTGQIAKKYTSKVYSKGPERSAQRNFGASKSQGEYLLFLDSDMVLTENVLDECVKRMVEEKVGGIIIPEKSFGNGFWAKVKALERKINEGEDYFEAARFFPKKIFRDMGGYDENLTGPEDWDFPQRVARKYKIVRTHSYILHNEGEPSLKSFAKRKYYYGLSVHKYLKKQNLPAISPRTVYFLRRSFYKRWKELLVNPLLSAGMLLMLFVESAAGGLGYLVGRFNNES
ncbi:MAG: Glycosyl transferase family 2 [Microgenomates group bacterium GW2011_GWA2_39_19]|nr:MAG: Glycosyl transferase family 2 [Microgenomates group bacterium GW2011_GWA2_39_19]HBL51792.1 glycosyl transferase family 2 [Candidatus Blackburnbacteria bacterium]